MRLLAGIPILVLTTVLLANDSQEAGKKVLTPKEAAKLAKESLVTVEMEVKSVAESVKKEHWFLNSEADYKDAKNFAVFIPKSVVEAFKKMGTTDVVKTYKGKTIQVTGFLAVHEGRPQITLLDTKSIKIKS
jgi:DNA/RNA endonuclease YhcR with UshA esterase domain